MLILTLTLTEKTKEDAIPLVRRLKRVELFALILAKSQDPDEAKTLAYHSLIVNPDYGWWLNHAAPMISFQSEQILGKGIDCDASGDHAIITLGYVDFDICRLEGTNGKGLLAIELFEESGQTILNGPSRGLTMEGWRRTRTQIRNWTRAWAASKGKRQATTNIYQVFITSVFDA